LDTPWPKWHRLSQRIGAALSENAVDPEQLLPLLHDRRQAKDGDLPDTGIGIDWERRLSPAFIVSPEYGTRCSTVLRVGHTHLDVLEVSYDEQGNEHHRKSFEVELSE